jgi:hypothetical protein
VAGCTRRGARNCATEYYCILGGVCLLHRLSLGVLVVRFQVLCDWDDKTRWDGMGWSIMLQKKSDVKRANSISICSVKYGMVHVLNPAIAHNNLLSGRLIGFLTYHIHQG